jgi:4-aminobutyrate aminotransferase-like enzyme
MDAWPESKGEAMHTSTFLGHPVGCAAALAFLDVLVDDDLVRRSAEVGRMILTGLSQGLEGVDGVLEVRGRGLLMGVELSGRGSAANLTERALREGLLLLPAGEWGDVVELIPPATLTEVQMDHAVDAVTEVVRRWAGAQ